MKTYNRQQWLHVMKELHRIANDPMETGTRRRKAEAALMDEFGGGPEAMLSVMHSDKILEMA